jgi:2,4-dienoyl-CoA reductase-like NADH-dependent reductase (Old Yellow Enzyme family)/thioredoxin reductase
MALTVDPDVSLRYPLAFSPFTLKNVELRNRMIRPSMGSGLPVGGLVSDDLIAFHVARARGGVSLTYIDPAKTHWSSPAYLDNQRAEIVDGLRRLTSAVHAEGAAVFQQLMHGGPTNIPQDGTAPWGASAVPDPGLGMVSRPMTRWMIDEVAAGFVTAARHAQQGGVDGVEVHAGHGYVFSSFLSPATNHRTDEYGGSFDNRIRLLCEVLQAVRAGVGADYPLGVRLSADAAAEQTTGADIAHIAGELERRGLVDFVNLSLGSHYGRDLLMGGAHEPPGYQLEVNGEVARGIGLPTIVTGRFGSVEQVEKVLGSEAVDLVGMVRATIADPDLIRKTAEGRSALIRPCIACNQGCAGGLNTRGRVGCTVNPIAGREVSTSDESLRTAQRRHVLVIGGGPCGVEAARAAAVAGHAVMLVEAADELGGQLQHALSSPHRNDFARLLDYFSAVLEDSAVDVRLGTVADADLVRSLAPDAVVVATGSTPRRDAFQTLRPWGPPEGFQGALTSWEVLDGAATGETVVILDDLGHYETLDVAQLLVSQGKRVRMISRFSMIAASLEMRWDMIGAPNAKLLYAGDFDFYPRRVVSSVAGNIVRFASPEAPKREESFAFDSLVTISGNVPETALFEELRRGPWQVRLAGDAQGARLLEAATYEGNQAIRSLETGWVRPAVRFGQTGSAM